MYTVIGAAMEVYNELGRGMEEPIYQNALQIELEEQGIPYEREKKMRTFYKGKQLKPYYYADFICFGNIVVELKSVSSLNPEHRAQLFNYMRITKMELGILINYGSKMLISERYVYDKEEDQFILITKDNYHDIINLI